MITRKDKNEFVVNRQDAGELIFIYFHTPVLFMGVFQKAEKRNARLSLARILTDHGF